MQNQIVFPDLMQVSLQALRLGVMVPGVPGYVPLQDRQALTWMKSDGNQLPDWWEIEKLKGPDDPLLLTDDGRSSGPMDQQNSVAPPTGDLRQRQTNEESSSHNFESFVRDSRDQQIWLSSLPL